MTPRARFAGGAALAVAWSTGACLTAAAPAAAQPPAPASATLVLPPDTAGQGLLAAAAGSPRRLVLRSAGDRAAGDVVRDVLAAPYLLVIAPDTGLTLGRDTRVDRSLVVLGGPVRLASTVAGEVLVFGDLFLRPGADVRGRGVAMGGGAYNSTLARVGGGLLSYRGVQPRASSDAGTGVLALDLRADGEPARPRLSLPGAFGFGIPLYDRVNGLSFTFGPELALDTGRVVVEPFATYRSQLGVVDAGLRAEVGLTRGVRAELRAERGTFTNDAWARRDLINAVIFAATGADARNYYRADRAELTLTRPSLDARGVLEPLVGLRVERASSVARDSTSSRPFTVFGRDDVREGARRPNPAVTGGRITSAFLGALFRRDTEAGTRGRVEARVEQALEVERAGRFTRAVVDVALERPLPGERRVVLLGHAVATAGRDVPSQRYAYLGGGPTLPSLLLLEQGGTQLVWAEGRYTLPLRVVRVPVVGAYPNFTLRAMAGAAGVNTLPALTPNVGLRLSVGPFRLDYVFDPTGDGRRRFGGGVGLR